MTSAEESHWIALYRQDPWGEQRADMRAALIAQMQHNTHAKKPRKLDDFMLFKSTPDKSVDNSVRTFFSKFIGKGK